MAATVTNSKDIVTNSELSLEVIRLTAAAGDALEVAADNSATLIKHVDDMDAHGKDVDAAIKTAVDAHNTASTPHPGKFAAAAHDHHMGNLIGVLPTAKGGTGRSDGRAVALATPRTISLAGDVTGSANFDGTGNVSISATAGSAVKVSLAERFFFGNF